MITVARVRQGVARRLQRVRFDVVNRLRRSPVADGDGPVVTLSTHGVRLRSVHLAIESIARGTVRPRRLILWLGAADAARPLPPALRRLVARGLEVRGTTDRGPHTKYYPLVSEDDPDGDFVTADDDIFYPRRWLADLMRAAARHPGAIVCHRAHEMAIDGDAVRPQIAPYVTWKPCRTTTPSVRTFPTGVSGVLYPAGFVADIRAAGTGFEITAPRADDVWLHAVAVRAGRLAVQVRDRPGEFLGVPGTRPSGLYRTNEGGGNDRQISDTYAAALVAVLAAGSPRAPGGDSSLEDAPRRHLAQ